MNNLTKKKPNEDLVLTRYLYAKDEVFLSMISAMLTHNLNETLFWFGEWITAVSYEEATQEIWRIYYDFYSIKNPKIERYINNKIKIVTKDVSEIHKQFANIIKNLVIAKNCSEVFLLRQFMKNGPFPNQIYKGRRAKWLQTFDKEYANLLLSLHKRHWQNVCFYLNVLHKKIPEHYIEECNNSNVIDDLHNVIITYFQSVEKISINMEFVFKKWADISYQNKKHLLLAIIVYLTKPEEEIVTNKKMFVSVTQKELDIIYNPEKYYCITNKSKKESVKCYDKLKFGRLYSINKIIGSFELARFNVNKDYKDICNSHWEYFAIRSEIWKERMVYYDIETDEKTYKIIFRNNANDDKYESFYEKYGYEPDEQPSEIQDKSLLEIPEMEYKIWFDYCFPDVEPILELESIVQQDSNSEQLSGNNLKFSW